MRYLIRADQPFTGSCISFLLDNGTVAYTGGMSLADYERERGVKLRAIDNEEYDKLYQEYIASRITKAVRVSKKKWHEALNVLPPARWERYGDVEFFHVNEHIVGSLVDWYIRVGERYYHFVDRYNLPSDKVMGGFKKE